MKKSLSFLLLVSAFTFLTLSSDVAAPPPPGAIGPYLNGLFPTTAPGSSYELEDILPGESFNGPLRILPFPNSEDILVLCKVGELWRINLESKSRKLLLDITDRSFKLGEGGTVGMALHPEFGNSGAPDEQLIFLFYRTKPEPDAWSEKGFNRLSKFSYDPQNEVFLSDSEEILIQQYDRFTWHNGGGMFFDEEGYLFLSVGDEGADEHQIASTQRLDGGLFSGVLRIDVDNDPSRSHPIIRQAQSNATPPADWEGTYTQGYSIPNDNPWLSPEGEHLEEFWAIGVRSPYSIVQDPETDKVWLADVGAGTREEINTVAKGQNLQWPYREGTFVSETHSRPEELIGEEQTPFYEYERDLGSCVIGGGVYRGTAFPELNGKYLFGDYTYRKVLALSGTAESSEPTAEVLIGDLNGQPVEMPDMPGVTGVFPMPNGEILLTVMGEDAFKPGKIYRIKRQEDVPEPPVYLSDLGVFADLSTLEVNPGIIPYRTNSPLWSDHADKQRWMVIPNDGIFNEEGEQIKILNSTDWKFPAGTVFIKHFELPLTTDPDGPSRRLETRFFVVDKNLNAYGVTYKWNEEETDAVLLGGGTSQTFDITENNEFVFTQTWDFPSRDQCMSCHNDNADYVLGLKTHQLNGDLYYESIGREMNQLSYLSELGVFNKSIGNPANLLKSYPISDESAPLEARVRSYLDSNCSSCHRLGGIPRLTMDLRYGLPLGLQNMIGFPTKSHASNQDRLLVEPGNHQDSELWIRDASNEEIKMPPLARQLVDEPYIEALAEWIDNLSEEAGEFKENLLYPNPTGGILNLRMNDDWQAPYFYKVYSTAGIEVYSGEESDKTLRLDFTNLAKGVYSIEIRNADHREIRKFVIN